MLIMPVFSMAVSHSTPSETHRVCSPQGLKIVDRFLFVNERCVEEYGEPRPQEECSRLLSSMSEDAQEKRRTWLTKAAMVSPCPALKFLCLASLCAYRLHFPFKVWIPPVQGRAGHQACMDSKELLMPVFSGVSLDVPSRLVRVDSKVAYHQKAHPYADACSHSTIGHVVSCTDHSS